MLSETRPAKVGKWTEPALRVLRERYLMRQGGEVVETPEEMCWRVALTIARGEARYGRVGCCILRQPQRAAFACGPAWAQKGHGGGHSGGEGEAADGATREARPAVRAAHSRTDRRMGGNDGS